MTGPTWESGQRVQRRVTSDPAAAAACSLAGAEPPLHWTSMEVTSSTGPLPGIDREILSGCFRCQHDRDWAPGTEIPTLLLPMYGSM